MVAAMNPMQMQYVTVANDDADFLKNAAGLTVFWTLRGDVKLTSLVSSLALEGLTKVEPPAEPTAIRALHRAVDAAAKVLKLDVQVLRRGEYAIVGDVTLTDTAPGFDGGKVMTAHVHCTAKVGDGDQLVLEGEGTEHIRKAYETARASLAPADIGAWLCDKLRNLKAVPLRERGGIYFIPADTRKLWERLVRALKRCSAHNVHAIPAMRGSDAVDAILAALTSDTMATVEEIDKELRGEVDANGKRITLGHRALDHRQKMAEELLARVAHYENLLGTKLDELRGAMVECQGAITSAIMAQSAEAT